MNEDVLVVKVEKIAHGEYSAIDPQGTDYTEEIPDHALRRAVRETGFLYEMKTSSGSVQWRNGDPVEFANLFTKTRAMTSVDNNNTEAQEEVREFIHNSVDMIPEDLKIADIKWKYLIRSIVRGNNILMTGPSGCGKTLVAQTLANVFSDRQFFSFNLGATQDARASLIGNTHYNNEKGTFVAEALFVRAIQTPNAIILLDEFSRAHHDAVNILMTVLDKNQQYLRIDEDPDTPTINVADGVSFIATANIGAEYTATRVIDRAILDRFQIIEMDPLSEDEEFVLLKTKYPGVPSDRLHAIAEIADHTRKSVKSDDPQVSTIISTRQSVELAGLLYDGFTLEDAATVCIYPFYPDAGGIESERTYMKQVIQKYIDVGGAPPSGIVTPPDNLEF